MRVTARRHATRRHRLHAMLRLCARWLASPHYCRQARLASAVALTPDMRQLWKSSARRAYVYEFWFSGTGAFARLRRFGISPGRCRWGQVEILLPYVAGEKRDDEYNAIACEAHAWLTVTKWAIKCLFPFWYRLPLRDARYETRIDDVSDGFWCRYVAGLTRREEREMRNTARHDILISAI